MFAQNRKEHARLLGYRTTQVVPKKEESKPGSKPSKIPKEGGASAENAGSLGLTLLETQ